MRTLTLHDWIKKETRVPASPSTHIEIGCEDPVKSPPNKRYCCTNQDKVVLVVVLVPLAAEKEEK
jgi:hypothetical protein